MWLWRLIAAPALLALAACGGGDAAADGVASLSDATEASADTTEEDASGESSDEAPTLEETEAQMLEFAACMRDEGIDIGDPVVDADGNVTFGDFGPGRGGAAEDAGEGVSPEGTREAFDACRESLDGVQLGGGRGDIDPTELEDSLLEYTQCLRDQGLDVDDPDLSGFGEPGEGNRPGPGGGPLADLDRDDPAVQAAMDECSDLFTGFGPGGRGGQGGQAPAGGDS